MYDAQGEEIACADHYRFDPDPVVSCVIPADGQYTVEITDALYRGREDFVYRISIGELPFVTSIFPLGGQAGAMANVQLAAGTCPRPTWPSTAGTGSRASTRCGMARNPSSTACRLPSTTCPSAWRPNPTTSRQRPRP